MKEVLTVLKSRVLLHALDHVPETELHASLIREADSVLGQAVSTGFPTLVFPCLFAERMAELLELEAHLRKKYWCRIVGSVGNYPTSSSLCAKSPVSEGAAVYKAT